MKTYSVSYRVLAGGLLFVALLLISWLLWQPELARAVGAKGETERASRNVGLASPETELSVRERAALASPRIAATDEASVEIEAEPVLEVGIWSLVAKLEALAEDPESFHELALPVLAKLTEACGNLECATKLLGEVILDDERDPLVRGGVLIAVATLLPANSFELTFRGWFTGADTEVELLRAAAVAAALRGVESHCGVALDLAYLGLLQGQGDQENLRLPGIYPLRLRRTVGQSHAEVLRGWLDDAETRARSVESSAAARDPKELTEFFVTTETVFAIWGHAALQDPEIEEVVVQRTLGTDAQHDPGALLQLRVAHFLVHSLAPCNDRFFDLVVRMQASEDPVVSAMTASMEGHLSAGIGVALMSKIENVRYSTEPGDYALLSACLLEVGDGLASIADPNELEWALEYLDNIVQDELVHPTARSIALSTLGENGQWPALARSFAGVVRRGVSRELYAAAVTSLMQAAGADPVRRSELVTLLDNAREFATDPWVRSSLTAYLEELSR